MSREREPWRQLREEEREASRHGRVGVNAAVKEARRVPKPDRPLKEIVAEFRCIARDHGYALAEHGSKNRDYDLIAAPWTKDAKAASTLVRALSKVGGIRLKFHTRSIHVEGRFAKKPHGRLSYVFLIEPFHYARRPRYIDLSVMARATNSQAKP